MNNNFDIFLGRVDQVDLKRYFRTDFSYSNLHIENNNDEYVSSILKAMENSLVSECKCFISNKMNINDNPSALKQKISYLEKTIQQLEKERSELNVRATMAEEQLKNLQEFMNSTSQQYQKKILELSKRVIL